MRNGSNIAVACALAALLAHAPGPHAGAPAPRTIAAALDAEDSDVRRAAAAAAGWFDRTAFPDAAGLLAPRLALALDDPDEAVRLHAAGALRALGPDAVEPLIAAFRAPPAGAAREPFARALGTLGPAAAAATPVLIDAIADPRSRWEATRLADAVGAFGPAAAPGLIRALEERPQAREPVLRALTVLGPAAGPDAVGPATAILAGDPDPRHRFSAALALGTLGDVAVPAIPALLAALGTDDNASVRMYAAQALGPLGRHAPERAVRGLLDALRAGDRRIAARAVASLSELGTAALDPTLEALANSGDPFVREHAAGALRAMAGAPVPPRIEGLLDALSDPVERVREAAAFSLRGLGDDAVPTLMRIAAGDAAQRTAPALRAWAAVVLGRMDPVPIAAVPALRAALRDDDSRLREAATWGLGKLGPDAAEARPELVAALDDDNAVVRRNAAWALGNAGRLAAAAAPRLEKASRQDPDDAVRLEANEALRKVSGTYEFAATPPTSPAAAAPDAAPGAAAEGAGTAPEIPSIHDVYASGTRAAVLGPSGAHGGDRDADAGPTGGSPAPPRGGSVSYDFRLIALDAAGGPGSIRGSAALDLDGSAPRWRAAIEGEGWAGTLRRDGDRIEYDALHGAPPPDVETLGAALLSPQDLQLDSADEGWIAVPVGDPLRGEGWTRLHRADAARRELVDRLLWRDAWCPTEVRHTRLDAAGGLSGLRLTVQRAEPGPPLPARAFR